MKTEAKKGKTSKVFHSIEREKTKDSEPSPSKAMTDEPLASILETSSVSDNAQPIIKLVVIPNPTHP
jgi:hypothetical protein